MKPRIKNIITTFLVACMLISFVPSFARADNGDTSGSNTASVPTITEEALFYFAPQYLNNSFYTSQYGTMESYCNSVVDSISDSDVFWSALIGSLKDGDQIIINEMLAGLLGDDSYGITASNNKKLAGALLNEYFSVDTVDMGLIKDVDKDFSWIRKTISTGELLTKDQLKNSIKSKQLVLSNDQIDAIFNDVGISNKILGVYSDSVDIFECYVSFFEMTQYELESIDILMEYIDSDSYLYDGLSQIRDDILSDPVEYIFNNYLSDKVINWLAGEGRKAFFDKLGQNVGTEYAIALLVGDVIGTIYEQFNPSYKDIFYAILMEEYCSEADRAVNSIISTANFEPDKQIRLSDYKCCYNFYLSCLKHWMNKCIKVASDDVVKAKLQNQVLNFDYNYSYDKYMTACLSLANKSVSEGKQVLNTSLVRYVVDEENSMVYECVPYGNNGIEICYTYYIELVNSYEEAVEFSNKINDFDSSIGTRTFLLDITLPSNVLGLPVLCICNDGVENTPSLEKVINPGKTGVDYPQYESTELTHNTNSVNYPDTIVEIGSYGGFCAKSNTMQIPAGITIIGDFAFKNCGFEQINIPASVTSIGECAFDNCSKLEQISIPDGVTNIGYRTFAECSNLTSIDIPDSVSSIGDYAFYDCISLESIVIPNGVTWIGDRAFKYCENLSSVTLSESITSIGFQAFCDCYSLAEMEFPNSLTTISDGAFGSCPIQYAVLPNNLVYMGNHVFISNDELVSIEIPNTVEYIGAYTFSGCSSLSDIYYNGTEEQWDQIESFDLYGDYVEIDIPEGCIIHFTNGTSSEIESPTTPTPTTPIQAPTTPAPTTPVPEPEFDPYANVPTLTSGVAHVQDIGNVAYTVDTSTDILTIGTRGMGKRMEEITINWTNTTGLSGTLEYRVHVQDIGWMDWVEAGQKCGTEGMSKRIEAIEIRLTGELAEYYSVQYCVHIQDYGDMQGWVKDGALAGTTGESKRIEELKIKIVPANSGTSMSVKYRVHVQDYGWEGSYAADGKMSGTSGESKRLEGIEIFLDGTQYSGGIKFKTHVQDYGWQGWSYDGEMSGTQGESKRLEGICIELYGEVAEYYDIYYRVHAQDIGWMAWAKNGECAGTAGRSARLEGIQIVLVPKGDPAPGATYEGITAVTDLPFKEGF